MIWILVALQFVCLVGYHRTKDKAWHTYHRIIFAGVLITAVIEIWSVT